jgi:hypothetical protein
VLPITSVSIVELSNGLVFSRAGSAPTLDVPPRIAQDVELSIDGIGLLHFAGASGVLELERARFRPLSERLVDEPCYVSAGRQDGNGWDVYTLCVLDPDRQP